MSSYHTPVLVKEVIDGLAVESKKDGVFVDCTYGGGGHSGEILNVLGNSGKLIAFDQDEDARQNLPDDSRLIFEPHNFRHLQRFLRLHRIGEVDGVLADLGVSSHQLDVPQRGFSTRLDGELDMRMDNRLKQTAFDIVNTYNEERLHKLFEQYGEVTNAKTLARTIVNIRRSVPLKTTSNFIAALNDMARGNPNKYFAQVFQALRIEVNDEMGALKELLSQIPMILKPGGRVAIITFHSLEDRIVKEFFKKGNFENQEDLNPFKRGVSSEPVLKMIYGKPVIPGEIETKSNPRSRSAKLRIAEKRGNPML